MAGEFKHIGSGNQLTKTGYEDDTSHFLIDQASGDLIVARDSIYLEQLQAGANGQVLLVV